VDERLAVVLEDRKDFVPGCLARFRRLDDRRDKCSRLATCLACCWFWVGWGESAERLPVLSQWQTLCPGTVRADRAGQPTELSSRHRTEEHNMFGGERTYRAWIAA